LTNTTNFPSLTTRVSQEESRESSLFSSLDARLEREEKAVIIRDVPVTGGSNHIMIYGPLGPVGGTGNADDDDIVIHGALRDKGDDNNNPIISLMLSGHNADTYYDPNTEGVAGHNAVFRFGQTIPSKTGGANGLSGTDGSDYVCDVTFVKKDPDTPSGGIDSKRSTDGNNLA
jgi:hypothetical protein